jgi:hypothetical protein
LIRMQVCEIYFACTYTCVTKTVGERLVQLPSARVCEAVEPHTFDSNAVKFLKEIPDRGIYCLLTWPTLPSMLQRMAKNSEDLRQKVHPEPKAGGFVKANRLIELHAQKFGSWEDCIEQSPRERDLTEVLERLEIALEGEMNDDKNKMARDALASIQGDHYSSYVCPSEVEIAAGARKVLEKQFKELPTDHVIVIERVTISALEAKEEDWFREHILIEVERKLLPERALSLVRATSGHRVVITPSYFVAMGETASTEARFLSVKAYLAYMDLLCESGNLTAKHVERQREILKSFLMGLDFGDPDISNYRNARQFAMPQGYFAGSKKDVVLVSQHLGIGYAELLWLWAHLGKAKTGKLLVAHGLQASSPLEPTWACDGAPPAPGIEAVACTNHQGDDLYAVMVGGQQPNHYFRGHFSCQKCHRKFAPREKAMLEELKSTNKLGEGHKERLEELNGFAAKHREGEQEARQNRIDSKGLSAVKNEESIKSRAHQSRLTEIHEKDSVAYSNSKRRNKQKEKKRTDGGGQKKASGGSHRADTSTKKKYPLFFMDMLTEATRIWAREYGQPYVYWNHLVLLFDLLLIREHEMGKVELEHTSCGKTRYLDEEYRLAAGKVVDPCKSTKKKWKYGAHVAHSTTKYETVKALLPRVVELLYKDRPEL